MPATDPMAMTQGGGPAMGRTGTNNLMVGGINGSGQPMQQAPGMPPAPQATGGTADEAGVQQAAQQQPQPIPNMPQPGATGMLPSGIPAPYPKDQGPITSQVTPIEEYAVRDSASMPQPQQPDQIGAYGAPMTVTACDLYTAVKRAVKKAHWTEKLGHTFL